MKRVTPSSKLRQCGAPCPGSSRLALSDVVDVDHVMDVVVLQYDLLLGDREALTRGIDGVERSTEIGVGRFVTKTQRDPIEPHLYKTVCCFQQFHVADVVRRTR